MTSGSETLVHAGKKISANGLAALKKANVEWVEVADAELEGAFAAGDVVDPSTGEVILEANEELTPRVISMAQEKNVDRMEIFFPERDEIGPVLSTTLKKDPIHTHEEALIEIYRRLRPGDPPTLDSSRSLFENMFFNPQKYDFSRVGRLKLNTKLKLNTPLDEKILHPQDFYEVIKYLLKLRQAIPPTSTTSITSATGACARSASSSRTSSASASSAWSARSRRRCRSTRKWRPPCRTT